VIRATIALLCLLATASAHAEPTDAEAKASARQVLIALRILAYDKALAERRPGDTVTIIIVSGGSVAGRAERERWQAGFALVPKVKVGGRSVRVVALDYGSREAFDAALAKHAPAAVIVAHDLEGRLSDIRAVVRARRCLSIGGERALRAGLSVAVVPGHERDEILINLEASRAEGVRFAAGLLQLAKIVEETP
jgi:hypothetical protein